MIGMALLVWLVDWSQTNLDWTLLVLELLPYMVDGLAHYAEKVGDTQQLLWHYAKKSNQTNVPKFPMNEQASHQTIEEKQIGTIIICE